MLPRIPGESFDEESSSSSQQEEPQRRGEDPPGASSSSPSSRFSYGTFSRRANVHQEAGGDGEESPGEALAAAVREAAILRDYTPRQEEDDADEETERSGLLESLLHPQVENETDQHSNNNNETTETAGATEGATDHDPADQVIAQLTRRLRCLFGVITWPIVPLGTLAVLALLAFLYSAMADYNRECSHPLKGYALATTLLVLYTPHHRTARQWISGSNGNNNVNAALIVRRYDQLFHTAALFYVYAGITLVQTCKQDGLMQLPVAGDSDAAAYLNDDSNDATAVDETPSTPAEATTMAETGELPADEMMMLNTCEATCPNLFGALAVYVMTLEVFTCSLLLPLLCLPCIYLWFVRAAAVDDDVLTLLQERLREEEDDDLFGNSSGGTGVTVHEVLQHLQPVRLVRKRQPSPERQNNNTFHELPQHEGDYDNNSNKAADEEEAAVLVVPKETASDGATSLDHSTVQTARTGVRECCICMNEFVVTDQSDWEEEQQRRNYNDVETGVGVAEEDDEDDEDNFDEIVQTRACRHLFHRHCIEGWVGGRWQPQPTASAPASNENTATAAERQPLTASSTTRPNNNGTGGSSADSNNNNVESLPPWMRRRAKRSTCPLCRSDLRTVHISS